MFSLFSSMSAMVLQSTMLAIESQQVITMRLTKFASGGPDVQSEAELMVNEKVQELMKAGQTLMKAAFEGKSGLGIDTVLGHYRETVSANVARLSA
ncbi:MAG: hypothetical protein B7Z75_09710 [Acidocella sp. 20-57-95]|nr:MAG: hypothetical protein B7Z75_09710 [Acidocella sp. 20-57-95]OYV60929.1 MAG: hypothetical protein B7Z71_05460 [Acidocella sp. 21-58-7]HQT64992.1 hypothetical protein [Acidocella sp.]HQU04025.1 hypothetical protein [Acidocella sp.]